MTKSEGLSDLKTCATYEDLINHYTLEVMARGMRVFQGALLAPSEPEHVHCLLNLMAPPREARILDLGCGVGEVARLMTEERGDLRFWLINENALQLRYAPVMMPRLCCDYHHLPYEDADFDGAMFCYALGYAEDFIDAIDEAARLVRQGGFLFVYDYERLGGDNDLLHEKLSYRAIPRRDMLRLLDHTGWILDWWDNPRADDARMRDLYGNDEEYDRIFGQLRLCAWRAVRL